jgi:K+-sensing histidine kinase KdpD
MKNNITDQEKFFSKVSHDLRGAFTSILGFSDIVNDPNEKLSSEEVTDFVERISKQSKDTYDLLVNFINWLKLENYNYGLTKENLELFDEIHEVKTMLKNEFESKNISVKMDIDDKLTVAMDYEILRSIIHNTFMFLMKICSEKSLINISSKKLESNILIEFDTISESGEVSQLQRIDLQDLNNELSFPIIFAIKFTEQVGGKFDFTLDAQNNIVIKLLLPSSLKFVV